MLHNLIMEQKGTKMAVRKPIKIVVKQQAKFLSTTKWKLIMMDKIYQKEWWHTSRHGGQQVGEVLAFAPTHTGTQNLVWCDICNRRPSGAIFSLPSEHALRSSSRATSWMAAAPPGCVLSARTSFSPISLDSSAGEKVYFVSLCLEHVTNRHTSVNNHQMQRRWLGAVQDMKQSDTHVP